MRYPIRIQLAIGLASCVLVLPAAQAQLGSQLGGLGSFSLGNSSQASQQPQQLDKIVAVVNDDVILASELNEALLQFQQQNGGSLPNNVPPNVLRSQVLDQLIMRQLQIQRAQKDGIQVKPAELQQGLARIAQRNKMNLSQFSQAVAQSGMSMDALRQRVREEIEVSKVRQKEVMGKVSVSDADVDRALQNQSLRFSRDHEYRLQEIRLDLPDDADSTTVGLAHSRLDRARAQITSGQTSFADAARHLSQADDAENGGQMGWVAGNDLPDSFDAALSDLLAGDVSDVFRGDNGMYLLKLEDERGSQSSDDDSQKVMVTEADLQHIVLKPNEIRSDARTRQLAQTIQQRLAAGDDFAALAKQYSDDSATATQGGDVGWIPLNRLAPSTRRHLQDLSDGQISRVFQSGQGYEIVKVNGKRQRDETDQAKREKVRQTIGRKRASEQGNLWLRKLRDEAYVDIRMPDYQPSPGTPATP